MDSLSEAGSHTTFFYGTLMAHQVLYQVIYGTSQIQHDAALVARAAKLTIQPALLLDYCRHRVRFADYPGIVPDECSTVRGTYVTGLTDADMQRLDTFEGPEYRRDKVQIVPLDSAPTVLTEVYVYIAGEEHLEKGEWDFDDFVRNRMPGIWASVAGDECMQGPGEGDTTGGRGIHTRGLD